MVTSLRLYVCVGFRWFYYIIVRFCVEGSGFYFIEVLRSLAG